MFYSHGWFVYVYIYIYNIHAFVYLYKQKIFLVKIILLTQVYLSIQVYCYVCQIKKMNKNFVVTFVLYNKQYTYSWLCLYVDLYYFHYK